SARRKRARLRSPSPHPDVGDRLLRSTVEQEIVVNVYHRTGFDPIKKEKVKESEEEIEQEEHMLAFMKTYVAVPRMDEAVEDEEEDEDVEDRLSEMDDETRLNEVDGEEDDASEEEDS
ncbi:hypothetical protein PENTCL1PPCAC_6796, partial [Pristionchus entomophagus]